MPSCDIYLKKNDILIFINEGHMQVTCLEATLTLSFFNTKINIICSRPFIANAKL